MDVKDLKCSMCEGNDVEYFNRGYEPLCEDCVAELLIDEAVNNNDYILIEGLEDEELDEIMKEIE